MTEEDTTAQGETPAEIAEESKTSEGETAEKPEKGQLPAYLRPPPQGEGSATNHDDGGTERQHLLGEKIGGDETDELLALLAGNGARGCTGSAFDAVFVGGADGRLHQNSDFLIDFRLPKRVEKKMASMNTRIVAKIQKGKDTETAAWFRVHEGDKANAGEPSGDDPMVALRILLAPGPNSVVYYLLDETETPGVVLSSATANIYLWKHTDALVISDIDGTITKSNAKGALGTTILPTNEHFYDKVSHEGICHLLSSLATREGATADERTTRVVYLTSRPITLANQTRDFLSGLKQKTPALGGSASVLPPGPLLGFGGKFSKVLKMELLTKSTQKFKAGKLQSQVIEPYREANEGTNSDAPPILAAFGNNLNDVQAYHFIGTSLENIYMINKKSMIVTFDKPVGDGGDENGEKESFFSHQWYKGRIGAEFEGYADAKLRYRLGLFDGDEEKKKNVEKYLVPAPKP